MTLGSVTSLLATMVLLALVPSPSVFLVVARAISSGFACGLATTAGIVLGDCIFIILAIYGLSAIAENIGSFFVLVKYLGGIYLIWLGIGLWRSQTKSVKMGTVEELSYWGCFFSGLSITLSDPKAILFYVSFFPAFIDLSDLSIFEGIWLLLLAIAAVGGVKLGYACVADRARLLFRSPSAKKKINILAGGTTALTGLVLILSK